MLRKDITTALNKEAAQRPVANNGGRRNENRHRISIGCADWLCNAKLFASVISSLRSSILGSRHALTKSATVKHQEQV
jgi:hypothetical protein